MTGAVDVSVYAVAVSGGFAIVFLGAFVLLALETWLLATGQQPITFHVRREVATYPNLMFMIGGALAFAAGALFSHFFWSGAGNGY